MAFISTTPHNGEDAAMSSTSKIIAAAAAAGLSVMLWAGPASAREPVDPSTLTPAPPDSFNATCTSDGQHISCDLAFHDPELVDEPSGIVCAGTEILLSQTRAVVGKRLYDADGYLLRRHFREYLAGTFTNPTTGGVVWWSQHDTVRHDLAIPGDIGTGSTTISGLQTRAWDSSGRTVLTDSGSFTIDEATGELLGSSAHHPFDDYFAGGDASALAPLCDALG